MNDPEETMHHVTINKNRGLLAHRVAIDAAAMAIQLAGDIHSYLRDHHVLAAEPAVRDARLALVAAARAMLRTGLGLLGVAAPDRM